MRHKEEIRIPLLIWETHRFHPQFREKKTLIDVLFLVQFIQLNTEPTSDSRIHIISSRVMRIQNQKTSLARLQVCVNTENGVRQLTTTSNHHNNVQWPVRIFSLISHYYSSLHSFTFHSLILVTPYLLAVAQRSAIGSFTTGHDCAHHPMAALTL